MNLSLLLEGVPVAKVFQTVFGQMVQTHDVHVSHIVYDSRKVDVGDLFVAIRGSEVDGHLFIKDAIDKGAKVVVLEDDSALPDSYFMHTGVVKIVTSNARKTLALMSRNFYGNPQSKLRLIGVTGTNGKTTTTHLIKSILEESGEKVGLIGTIAYVIGNKEIPATHTTPESLELNQLLAEMLSEGCTSVVMEVSSHSLVLDRVYGFEFDAAVFTNLTQDHLDFHKTMDEYAKAKKILFDSLSDQAFAVVNADDEWSEKIITSTKSPVMLYAISKPAKLQAVDIVLGFDQTTYTIKTTEKSVNITSPLIGRFNIYNTLAAYGVCSGCGISDAVILRGLQKQENVRGRFERIRSQKGWTAVVDYAHTPDALDKCLRAIHDIFPENRSGKIITVFGAGGDRDRTKRKKMGSITAELSDVVIVTSDNPRTEDPEKIIDDIMEGIPAAAHCIRETNRHKAIEMALTMAKSGDVVILAGKGHENYQVIGKQKHHFDDREEVQNFINRT